MRYQQLYLIVVSNLSFTRDTSIIIHSFDAIEFALATNGLVL